MESKQLISELELYFLLYPVKKESRIFVSDSNIFSEKLQEIKNALFLKEVSTLDQTILDIISHCDENTKDELIKSFGEESLVAQVIRKSRIAEYSNSRKTYCAYESLKDTLQETINKIYKNGNPLYETVCYYIDNQGYRKDSDFYNAIGMPRQQFARLRDPNNNLSKKTVLWIIVGLKLNYEEADDLLKKAGYSFRKNDMRDVILMYIFRNTEYNLCLVNEVLLHFDLEPFC